MAKKQIKIITEAKYLALDMIESASSGHQGIAIDLANVLYVLYGKVMNYDPKNPDWINRDRLVLSAGHGSAILYSYLHIAGFNISIEDLKNFRKLNSKTPGHPEVGITPGVDAGTGALGSGVANAVGIALSEKYYSSLIKKENPKSKLMDHYTYCICGDGDLMEGVSYEALSFAGVHKLNKLILIYNANNMSIDGTLENVFVDDIHDRFESIGFNVFESKNNNIIGIEEALKDAKKSKKPSIVVLKGEIGESTKYQNDNRVHSNPLSAKDIKNMKELSGVSLEPFDIDTSLVDDFRKENTVRLNKVLKKWTTETDLMSASKNSKIIEVYNYLNEHNLKIDLENIDFKIESNYEEELRKSNQQIINVISSKSNFFLGGSADLQASCKTFITKSGTMSPKTPLAKNIAFGVRERAMGDIINGMALSGLFVYGSTFLTFSDYLKPAIRNSALMSLPVVYIFTHDSVSVGYDGPTHEPIEHLSALRMIPNFYTFRPADINEVIGAWDFAIKKKVPCALVVSKEKLKKLTHTNSKYVKYGAYMVRKEKVKLDAILIATGSEVHLALDAAKELFEEGIDVRVVSMPSVELFLKQHPKYEAQLLPKDSKIFTLEAGSSLIWNRFATNHEYIIGIDSFGLSGNPSEVLTYLGITKEKIKTKIKSKVNISEEFLF